MLGTVSLVSSSSSSSADWKPTPEVLERPVGVPKDCVAPPNCTVALGRGWLLGLPGPPGVAKACVLRGAGTDLAAGAPGVANCTVGAGAAGLALPPPAVFKGIVGAGGGVPPVAFGAIGGLGAVGAFFAVGGLGAAGGLGGAPAAGVDFRVTRTVSFFKGTADVFFIGLGGFGGFGGCSSDSLIRSKWGRPGRTLPVGH
jgi:hypothetical protein